MKKINYNIIMQTKKYKSAKKSFVEQMFACVFFGTFIPKIHNYYQEICIDYQVRSYKIYTLSALRTNVCINF